MKADNINAIRLSHYDHAERFMELCDEAGFYLLDEIPACWIASEVRDASRTWAYILRTKETLDRDKNRPCVVAWACGNESGYGVNNQAMFDYAKAHDATRPALISQQNQRQNPRTDFEDYHYPSIQQLRNMAAPNYSKIPVIITEAHSTDVGVAEVTNFWNIIWPADGIVGSFIWEWQAQGMYDKFPERWSTPAHGAAINDPKTGFRNAHGYGPVTAERQLTPMFPFLKTLYSPVTTAATQVDPVDGKFSVPLQNRYSFTDLSELPAAGKPWLARRCSPAAKLTSPPNHVRRSMPRSLPLKAWIPCASSSSTPMAAASTPLPCGLRARRLGGRLLGQQFHKLQQGLLRRIGQRLRLRVNQFRRAHETNFRAGCLTCKLLDSSQFRCRSASGPWTGYLWWRSSAQRVYTDHDQL